MMRQEFQSGLDDLERQLQNMSDKCARALHDALAALQSHDGASADDVIAFDDEVDQLFISIERGIEELLATQAPVAGDLRLALAILHINLHLERIADQCVNIAKLTKLSEPEGFRPQLVDAFVEMGSRAEQMLRVAMDSFANRDAERAETLTDLDELIDEENKALSRKVIASGSSVEAQEAGLRAMLISRCIERIGDNAVDIGEQTVFLVTGEFREFTDASHPS
jgi:phosphate transport system protein